MSEKIAAGTPFPRIELPTLEGQQLMLAEPADGCRWKLIVIYRGRHCPLCTRYLQLLNGLRRRFYALGIDLVAASADSLEQATEHQSRMNLKFPLVYGLTEMQMAELGLYVSTPRSDKESDHPFAEPGLFVVNADNRVQVVDISNGPFARPELETLLGGLSFIMDPANNYPIRGTHVAA
jgi:peroxiredoxin